MQSRYDPAEAQAFCERYASCGEDLALCVYTSRLLGAEPALVLHGGGNTSVKTRARDLFGDEVEALLVKGSGWDLASIEPAGFAACRLEPLHRCLALERMSDEAMVAHLRAELLDPASPSPSVEALLHAALPAKFVDHTHADAVLMVVDQPDSERRCRELFGDEVLLVPYVMPGFRLARRVAELWRAFSAERGREPRALILDKHGAFSWGASARESYERMIELVTRAEQAVADRLEPVSASDHAGSEQDDARRTVSLVVRGALKRASGRSWIARWRHCPKVLRFTRREDLRRVSQLGCVTPDHVIRTKGRPLLLAELAGGGAEALRRVADDALREYARRYDDTFAWGCAARGIKPQKLDPWPRVVLVPGLGALCLGASAVEADVVGDLYEHTVEVIEGAQAIGRYQPVDELDLFDVEYWSLEQAKLARAKKSRGALDGCIAMVTGAASGIGLATSRALLAAGAHVMITDRDARVLEAVSEWPAEHFPRRFATAPCNVASELECRFAIAATVDAFGGIDVLVSNAGTAPTGLLHTAGGDAALRQSLDVNLLGHQRVARFAADAMLAQDTGGALLFNASKSAFNQGPDFGPYAIAKAALVSLMRQYAVDLGKAQIRSNAVNADRIRTNLFGHGVLEARAQARGLSPSAYFRANLLGRETSAEEVADAFVYLATAEATTGCVVTVDGGNPAAFPR